MEAKAALRDREQFFMFDCEELDVKASSSDFIPAQFFKYMAAMSYVLDLPETSRDLHIDIGCGTGFGTELLGRFFDKSVGIDRDKEAIEYARLMHSRSGTEFLLNSELKTEQWKSKADFVSLIEVLEHVPQHLVPVLLSEISWWLKPEGVFFMTTPVAKTKDGLNPDNPWHLHEYQPGELKELLGKYFRSVELQNHAALNMAVLCKEPKR